MHELVNGRRVVALEVVWAGQRRTNWSERPIGQREHLEARAVEGVTPRCPRATSRLDLDDQLPPCSAELFDVRGRSLPPICVARKVRALRAANAEALPGWSLHHDPRLVALDLARTEVPEARDLGVDIVG